MKLEKVTRFPFSVTNEKNAIFQEPDSYFVTKRTLSPCTCVEEVHYVKTAKPLKEKKRKKKKKEINYTPNVFSRNSQLVNFAELAEKIERAPRRRALSTRHA